MKTNVVKELVHLGLLVGLVSTFEFVEDLKVLFRSEKVEEDIVLGTDSHQIASLIHIVEHVNAEQIGRAFRGVQ